MVEPVDDLDALLDEAMDMVDEQERQHEEDVKRREAKLEADLQTALKEVDGGAEGGDMIKMLQTLLSAGAAGGEMDDSYFENFKSDVGKLLETLENVNDLEPGDKANLERVKELMNIMDTDDEERAQEVLEKLKQEDIPGSSDMSEGDMQGAMKQCLEALQSLSTAAGDKQAPQQAQDTTAVASSNSSASAVGDEALPPGLVNMLMDTLLDPQFVEPIRLMRDAYEPWLAAHDDTLTQEEKGLYAKQHIKSVEICEFLEVPLSREDDERVARLLELMHEFSELGEPPKTLPEFAKKLKGDCEGSDDSAAVV